MLSARLLCMHHIELRGVLALDFVKYTKHTQHVHMHSIDSGLELHIKDVEYIAVM